MKKKREKHIKTNTDLRKSQNGLLAVLTSSIERWKGCMKSVERRTTEQKKALKLRMYNDIDSFPLLKFMDCVCDNNFTGLYKDQILVDSIRDKEVELQVYDNLYLEFLDRFFNNDTSIFEDNRRLMDAYCKLVVIEAIEQGYYRVKDNQTVKAILRKYNIFLTNDDATNIDIISSAKATLVRKFKQVEDNMNKETESGGWSRKVFIDLISTLSNFYDRQISVSLITVGEFCSLYQMMKQTPKKGKKKQYG